MISASSLALDPGGGGGPLPGSYMSYHHHLAAHTAHHHHLHHHRASVQDRYPPGIGVVTPPAAAVGAAHHLALHAGQHAAAGAGQLYHHSKPEFARPLPKARYNGAPSVSTSVTTSRPVVMTTAPQQQHYSRRTSPAPSPTPGPVDLAQPKDQQNQQPPSPQINRSPIRTQPPSLSPISLSSTSSLSAAGYHPTNHIRPDLVATGYHHQHYVYSNNGGGMNQIMSNHHQLAAQTHQYIKEREMYEARSGFVPPRPVMTNPVSSTANEHDVVSGRSRFGSQDKLPSPNNSSKSTSHQAFKVPSGKEGSLKHRILRPSPPSSVAPLSQQSPSFIVSSPTLLPANQTNAGHFMTGNTTTAPTSVQSPMTSSFSTSFGANTNSNASSTSSASSFVRGSLIRLAGGELRRIEDMRTEDFVLSARLSPDLRLADSTVVKIVMDQQGGGNLATLTLSYNGHRDQVDFESTAEHPFFVYGQGWASCSPERTLQQYGLKCNRLQVGDICISLTPRETPPHLSRSSNNNPAQATSKHQQGLQQNHQEPQNLSANQKQNSLKTQQQQQGAACAPAGPLADVVNNSKKRRWSAPDNVREDQLQRYALLSMQNGKRYRD